MIDSYFFNAIVIAQSQILLSIAWFILLKGSKRTDNLWHFTTIFFHQFMLILFVVDYFPVISPLFFIVYLLSQNSSNLFIYSFPRAMKLKKSWWALLTFINSVSIICFYYSTKNNIPEVTYILSSLMFFVVNLIYVIRKRKYLSHSKRNSVTKILLGMTTKNLFGALLTALALYSYDLFYLRLFIIIILPLYYFPSLYIIIKRINTDTSLTSATFRLLVVFSILISTLFVALSQIRVAILYIFPVSNFFIPAAIGVFLIQNVAVYVIVHLSTLINNYFDKKEKVFGKIAHDFRLKTDKLTSISGLFEHFHKTIFYAFEDVTEIDYIVFLQNEAGVELNKSEHFTYIGKCPEKIKKIINSSEPYGVLHMHTYGYSASIEISHNCELLIPITSEETAFGAFIIKSKSMNDTTAARISSLASMTIHNFLKISLFDKIVRHEKKEQDSKHLQEVGKMVSVIAHELRTPLTSIMFNMDVLMESCSNVEGVDTEYLEITKKEITRLNDTVGKMLTYGRTVTLSPESGTFGTFTHELDFLFSSSKVSINFINKLENEEFVLDWHLLKQVAINLISNAVEAIEKSSKGDAIDVTFKKDQMELLIEVTDNGPGIPENSLQSIFEPFFTTKREGNGLGLAICERIVKLMEGRIKLKNTSSNGTCFSVNIGCLPK